MTLHLLAEAATPADLVAARSQTVDPGAASNAASTSDPARASASTASAYLLPKWW